MLYPIQLKLNSSDYGITQNSTYNLQYNLFNRTSTVEIELFLRLFFHIIRIYLIISMKLACCQFNFFQLSCRIPATLLRSVRGCQI